MSRLLSVRSPLQGVLVSQAFGVVLLDSHLIGSRECAAGCERIGPLVAKMGIERNGRRNLLDRAVVLLLFDRGLGLVGLAFVYAIDNGRGAVGSSAAGDERHSLGDLGYCFVLLRGRGSFVLGIDGPGNDVAGV